MFDVTKVDLWSAPIDDSPGAIVAKVQDLVVNANLNLHFLLAERRPDLPGRGHLYLAPISGPAQTSLARHLGFAHDDHVACLRVSGDDEPGIAYRILRSLAAGNLNLRAVTVSTTRDRFSMYLALETPADAAAAAQILTRPL